MADPRLALFTGDTGGIDSWLTGDKAARIYDRLAQLPTEPLSLALLNQLLALSQQPALLRAFFEYYWCSSPVHPSALASWIPFALARRISIF
jgi:hypothetical protein